MNQTDTDRNIDNGEEITIKEIVNAVKEASAYIRRKWLTVLIAGIFGAILGLAYAIFTAPTYKAVCTFVLEDSKAGSGLGQYAGLASLAGITLGGNGGGIFQGDNILELYTSRTMIERALLTSCNFAGKNQLLINRFIDINHIRTEQKADGKIENISFKGDPDNFSRKQDSIITEIVSTINKKVLTVTKPDKKLTIINVEVVSKDELFSKYFTENLVQTVNKFYVLTKTKKESQNVQILQRQVDSVRTMLNSSINAVASANDAAPNANPQMSILRVTSQKRQIDVQANSGIYAEMVKNLELAKISLRQEMPLIQVIDKPVLPLFKNKTGEIKGLLLGFLLAVIVTIGVLILKKVFKQIVG
jgi:hypothetical protein